LRPSTPQGSAHKLLFKLYECTKQPEVQHYSSQLVRLCPSNKTIGRPVILFHLEKFLTA